MIRATATGRLGREPELRFTAQGRAVCELRVACDERQKNDRTGEWESAHTSWISVNVWGSRAEAVAGAFQKGDLVVASGRLRVEEWETQTGEKRTRTTLVADEVGAVPRNGAASRSLIVQQPEEAPPW